jgi:hypothetical protein
MDQEGHAANRQKKKKKKMIEKVFLIPRRHLPAVSGRRRAVRWLVVPRGTGSRPPLALPVALAVAACLAIAAFLLWVEERSIYTYFYQFLLRN